MSDGPRMEHEPDGEFAARLRGWGPLGMLATALVLAGNYLFTPLSALLALAWAWTSRTPPREMGFVRPRSWIRTLLGGIAFGIALKLLMKAIVMPLLGAPPINAAFHYLVNNPGALPDILYVVLVGAAFGEEVVFRGFAFARLRQLLGQSAGASAFIVLFTATWFGLVHYPLQGIAGVEQAFLVGLIFGSIFAVRGCIWFVMFAHAAFDLTAVAIIYLDLETAVAHFILK